MTRRRSSTIGREMLRHRLHEKVGYTRTYARQTGAMRKPELSGNPDICEGVRCKSEPAENEGANHLSTVGSKNSNLWGE